MTHCIQIQDLMGTFEDVFAEDPAEDLAATHIIGGFLKWGMSPYFSI